MNTETDDKPLPPRIPRLGWAVAFIGFTLAMALAYQQFKGTKSPRVSELPEFGQVPEFAFLDQEGGTISSQDLDGKIWVANFIFTRCPNPCPTLTSRMAELQSKLRRKVDDVRLLTFTCDADYDTPTVLKQYAEKVHADPARWSFVTGKKSDVDTFITRGMLQPLATEPNGLPAHSSRFVVVDGNGKIRSYHDGTDPEVVSKLLLDIGSLMREHPTHQPERNNNQ